MAVHGLRVWPCGPWGEVPNWSSVPTAATRMVVKLRFWPDRVTSSATASAMAARRREPSATGRWLKPTTVCARSAKPKPGSGIRNFNDDGRTERSPPSDTCTATRYLERKRGIKRKQVDRRCSSLVGDYANRRNQLDG